MKIVCIGDSLTSGFGVFKDKRWTELMIKNHKLNIINKGINGDTTTGMLCRFFDDVLSLKPSLAIIMGGCNDFISKPINSSVLISLLNKHFEKQEKESVILV